MIKITITRMPMMMLIRPRSSPIVSPQNSSSKMMMITRTAPIPMYMKLLCLFEPDYRGNHLPILCNQFSSVLTTQPCSTLDAPIGTPGIL
jgi:hypothetical protein